VDQLGSLLVAGFFVGVFVHGGLFQVVSFENLVTIQAAEVFNPVTPHQELGTLMLASGHRSRLSLFYSEP
jgi:hypothetical protein